MTHNHLKMKQLKKRISRLIRVLGEPFNEIIYYIEVSDDLHINCLSVVEGTDDFEMSFFHDTNELETVIPSEFLSEVELEVIVRELEELLIKY